MGMKLSDTMVAVLVHTLDRQTASGTYVMRTTTPRRTVEALQRRGLADGLALTEAGVTEARKQQQATADLQRMVNEEAAKPAEEQQQESSEAPMSAPACINVECGKTATVQGLYYGTWSPVCQFHSYAIQTRPLAEEQPEPAVSPFEVAPHLASYAAELLGEGERWLRHWYRFGGDSDDIAVDREGALNIITLALRHGGWAVYRVGAGGVKVESPTGESSYWLEPMAQEAVSAPVSVQEQREGLPVGEAFVRAVGTARHAIPVMQSVVKPEAWCAHVIVRRAGAVEAYSVYPASAWEQPAEVPFLPWSPPVGERVAVVALDGSVSVYEGDPVARACEECDAAPGEPCSPLFTCGAQVAQDAEDVRAQQEERAAVGVPVGFAHVGAFIAGRDA